MTLTPLRGVRQLSSEQYLLHESDELSKSILRVNHFSRSLITFWTLKLKSELKLDFKNVQKKCSLMSMSLKMKYTEVNPLILYFPSVNERQTHFTAYKITIRHIFLYANKTLLCYQGIKILFYLTINVIQLRKVNFVYSHVKSRLSRLDLHLFLNKNEFI